jgi:hypothetical protein
MKLDVRALGPDGELIHLWPDPPGVVGSNGLIHFNLPALMEEDGVIARLELVSEDGGLLVAHSGFKDSVWVPVSKGCLATVHWVVDIHPIRPAPV